LRGAPGNARGFDLEPGRPFPSGAPDENLRRVFAGVMDDLSYAQAQGDDEGNIRATMRLTDDEDARAIARRIVDLYHEVDGLLR
jgi:hypothetical protein